VHVALAGDGSAGQGLEDAAPGVVVGGEAFDVNHGVSGVEVGAARERRLGPASV
jgi:hypothetical protein